MTVVTAVFVAQSHSMGLMTGYCIRSIRYIRSAKSIFISSYIRCCNLIEMSLTSYQISVKIV